MKTISKKHKFVAPDGNKVEIRITVKRGVKEQILDADGIKISSGYEIISSGEVVVSVNGKVLGRDYHLIRPYTKPIMIKGNEIFTKIAGGKLGLRKDLFTTLMKLQEKAIKEAETDKEYQNFMKKKKTEESIKNKKQAEWVVNTYKSGNFLSSYEEAKRYNDGVNEGGFGYVPPVITQKMYEDAIELLSSEEKSWQNYIKL